MGYKLEPREDLITTWVLAGVGEPGITESVDDILDENMGKAERLCVDNLEL
jgi:hypothetical protein